MESTICYSEVSNLYVDFIPQWGDDNQVKTQFSFFSIV